jgi:hypothetical protein
VPAGRVTGSANVTREYVSSPTRGSPKSVGYWLETTSVVGSPMSQPGIVMSLEIEIGSSSGT